jgi:hypothetical protein
VRAALNDWLTWKRPELVDTFDNYRFLRAELAPIYREPALPEALLFAIMATESRAKAHAFSRAGAAGPMQFMRRTAMRYGLGSGDGFDLRLDPVASTRASASYLNDRLDDLEDDLEKALAAYNVGESRLRRLHIKLDGSSLWDPAMQQSLPAETRRYVPKVLAAAWLFLHPDELGVSWPEPEAVVSLLLAPASRGLARGARDLPGSGRQPARVVPHPAQPQPAPWLRGARPGRGGGARAGAPAHDLRAAVRRRGAAARLGPPPAPGVGRRAQPRRIRSRQVGQGSADLRSISST